MVMVLLRELVRLLLKFSRMSFLVSFVILLGLDVLYLLALFHFGIVLLGLLAEHPLGGRQFLVMLSI